VGLIRGQKSVDAVTALDRLQLAADRAGIRPDQLAEALLDLHH
jgi:hypothetical protein